MDRVNGDILHQGKPRVCESKTVNTRAKLGHAGEANRVMLAEQN